LEQLESFLNSAYSWYSMRKVFFVEDDKRFTALLKSQIKRVFSFADKVAIKLHMGEPGNKNTLEPQFVKVVVDSLKSLGLRPFLFDSPVKYDGPRNTVRGYLDVAARKGFDEQSMGCPVIVSNESVNQAVNGLNYEVCKHLVEADGVLILTHVKGHLCCGFGGAIKNMGMGALSKETKGFIHKGGEPLYVGGCTMCGQCEVKCPTGNIRYCKGRPYFDKSFCAGCSNCARFCPSHSIKPKKGFFDTLLSQGAYASLQNSKKVYFVNVLRNITKLCDCDKEGGPIVLGDIGILLSEDIVAIDKASLDLINQKAGKDIFEEIHHKSPLVHIEEAKKLGMGDGSYELVR
jgi:hypothetical protein